MITGWSHRGLVSRLLAAAVVLSVLFPLAVSAQSAAKPLSFPFTDKKAHGTLFAPNPSSRIEWVSDFGKTDKASLKVTHVAGTVYTGAENAVRLTLAEPLPAGAEYNIVVWFYVPAAGNEGKETLTGPGVVINGEYALSKFKMPSDFGTMPVGSWKEVNVKTPLMETPLRTVDFRFVVNDQPKHADVWYIDEIVITQVGELQKIAAPKWDTSLPSLAETYKNNFLVGNIMSANQTSDAELTAFFKKQYNVVTAENDMKPQYLSPKKGQYSFANADAIVSWAQANGLKVNGHTLVWHSQSAPWLTADGSGKPLTRNEARENMSEYIAKVAGHFQGKLISWEVVNEAFDGGSTIPSDWKTVLRKNSPWYRAYENGADAAKGESGADYIYDAFVFARLADPKATLYYNDYNETDGWKREAIALMAEDLNKQWKADPRNKEEGRLLVEGLGMQSHFWVDNLSVADVEATIVRFMKAGVRVSVTELDIPAGSYSAQRTPPLSATEERAQARLYAQLFEVYKKYSSGIDRVTFWGKADPQSWRANGSPLLFDKAFAPKASFRAVLDSAGYFKSN